MDTREIPAETLWPGDVLLRDGVPLSVITITLHHTGAHALAEREDKSAVVYVPMLMGEIVRVKGVGR